MKMRKSRSHKNKRKTQRGGIPYYNFSTKKWEEYDVRKNFGLKKDDSKLPIANDNPSMDSINISESQLYSEVQKKETIQPKWLQITQGKVFLDYTKDNKRFQKVLDAKPYLVRDQLQQSWEKIKNDPTKRKEALDRWDPPRDLTPKKTIYDYTQEMVKNKEITERLYNTAINLLNSPEYTFSDKESLKIELESSKQKNTPDGVNFILGKIKNNIGKLKKIEQQDQDAMEEIFKRTKQDFRMMSRLSPESYSVRRSSLGPERTQGGTRKRKQTKRSKRIRCKSRRLRK